MFWMIVGVMLAAAYGLIWYVVFVGEDDDAQSVRDYEAQRREFESWFE